MKNALLVTTHPYTDSFNFALRDQMAELLYKLNWQINTSDLYQQGFSPILGESTFSTFPASIPLNLLKQQEVAYQQELFSKDIVSEQNKLLAADILILQFPLWWGSYPAMLKGWIENIISKGYAYGSQYLLAEKKVLLSVTTGGADNIEEVDYYQRKIQELGDDVFGYVKMQVLKPIINHGPELLNDLQSQELLASTEQHLTSLLFE